MPIRENPRIIKQIVDEYQANKDMLIQILLDLQNRFGWLSEKVLKEVSEHLSVPLTSVYQIATFYKAFGLAPKGRHTVKVCMGTACKSRGSSLIRDMMQQLLGVKPGETTPDMKFTFETVNCLGCCAMGPVITVDGRYHGTVKAIEIGKIIKGYG